MAEAKASVPEVRTRNSPKKIPALGEVRRETQGAGVIGPCGMAQYRMEGMSTLKARSPREIPRQVLHFGDKLGEGDFGTVHLGEVAGLTDTKESNGPCRQVVLAALRQDASPEVREDTWREAQLLATLSDPNLAGLVGVVSRDDPLVLIIEFLPLGDLNQYLRRHVPDTTTPRLNHMRPISYGSLIYMATQVASGMKYLEAHNITHRDLATRPPGKASDKKRSSRRIKL
ncbi:discoidin domain-containing receptor 2-like [Penaeus indicus]|uniref:discoidin domain-containing receptor 2-like n=1 Tax=Penaeus indicus TaxID=29960 RepID=UPI00300CF30B